MGYIVHKAVELDKVKAARRKMLSEPGFLETHYISQPKYDGCNMVAVVHETEVDTTIEFYSRTGERVQSVPHIGMALATVPGIKPGVYFGECWAPDLAFNEISGLFRRQTPDEETCRLQFAIFDYLELEEWGEGQSDLGYAARVARLPEFLSSIPQMVNPIWLAGSFGYIKDTWPNGTAEQVARKLVEEGGYDGLILRDPCGTWTKGDRGTGGEIIKVKPTLSFDLMVIGFETGKGKNKNKIGKLIVDFRGKELGVGTGLTDEERDQAAYWTRFDKKIVEVEAMGLSSDGLLREPRFKGIRYDKLEAD